jgi:hypothetical protein
MLIIGFSIASVISRLARAGRTFLLLCFSMASPIFGRPEAATYRWQLNLR